MRLVYKFFLHCYTECAKKIQSTSEHYFSQFVEKKKVQNDIVIECTYSMREINFQCLDIMHENF